MKHRLTTLVSTTLLLAGGLAGPAAAGAQHNFYPEDYDAFEHFAAGEGFCVSWAGTFHEVRHGGYRLVAAVGGQQPGEVHVNGAINGHIELVPDDPRLPTYTGDYREKVNGVVTESTDEGDLERVGQYRLRSTLQGTDGSTLSLRMSGKTTFDAHGVLRVQRDTFTCA